MFLTSRYNGYNRHGEQTGAGLFLMLVTPAWRTGEPMPREIRACVRDVRLRQCGHWMMGAARVGAARVTVSGAYGSDGLTMDGDKFGAAFDRLLVMPTDIAEAFWQGGGHNSTGSEAPTVRAWALANLTALRQAGR